MKRVRSYSRYANQAVSLLGIQIKLARKRYKWSEAELAERAGISRSTLQNIEAGGMNASIGIVFEVAALVGISLFDSDNQPLAKTISQTRDALSLLPKRIRKEKIEVDDDF